MKNVFSIEFSTKAKKAFDQINNSKIDDVLKILVIDPIPAKHYDVKKLQGIRDTFRIRIGSFRIVYTILWKERTIVVSRIASRESVYG